MVYGLGSVELTGVLTLQAAREGSEAEGRRHSCTQPCQESEVRQGRRGGKTAVRIMTCERARSILLQMGRSVISVLIICINGH
jgi:hypothetical protein